MRAPLQRKSSGRTRLDDNTHSQPGRSMPPPETVLQASAIDATTRNGIVDDNHNDALHSSYQSHGTDATLWAENPSVVPHIYGPAVGGDFAVQGQDDERAIVANDVHQGAIGNCYFLSAVAGLARQRPDLIRNAIRGPLPDGTYDVTLWSSRKWDESREPQQYTFNMSTSFVVYGSMDRHPNGDQFRDWEGVDAYAGNADRDEAGNEELWVKLIEKAFAIMSGGWEEVDGGFGGWPMMALEVLTGEPHMEHYFDGVPANLQSLSREDLTRPSSRTDEISDEELKTTIIQNLAAGNVVTATEPGHSITVLSADENGITTRDQALSRFDEEDGVRTHTWAEFRENFVKFTTRQP